jgi:hypothetical protein
MLSPDGVIAPPLFGLSEGTIAPAADKVASVTPRAPH